MSNNLEILPVLDTDVLKVKAQEAAMKGALKVIEEYYTDYNSPFKKAIREDLDKNPISHHLELPDVIALINQSLVTQIDQIANRAIAQTFIPLVTNFLTRLDSEIPFSDILKAFIKRFEDDDTGQYDFSITIDEEPKWEWLSIKLSCKKNEYSFTLHKNSNKDSKEKTYSALSLPFSSGISCSKMKVKVEGVELEMPFTKDVLRDHFTSFFARLVLSNSAIRMDVTDFENEMFEGQCHCH